MKIGGELGYRLLRGLKPWREFQGEGEPREEAQIRVTFG
jgi:hypothetical protein